MDKTDIRILELLQADARIANADIARELNMAPSAVLERVRKLEQKGIIRGFETRLEAGKVGLNLTAFLFVQSEEVKGPDKVVAALTAIPEVLEVHSVAGEDCFLVKVRVSDTAHLSNLLRKKIRSIPSIRNTRTTIVLETFKESIALPLDHLQEGEAS